MTDTLTRDRALWVLRVAWAAVLLEIVAVGAYAYWRMRGEPPAALTGDLGRRQAFLYIAMLAGTGIALFARMQLYKRFWRGDCVAPRGYLLGNLLLFAFIDAVAVASCALYLTGHHVVTVIFPALVMALLLAANYPTGSPMTPYRSPLA